MTGKSVRSAFALAVATVLFYWKILLTRQFTILAQWGAVNRAYAPLQFAVRQLKHGRLPLWDVFTFAGHPFQIGHDTPGFSPVNLLLSAAKLNSHGLLSPSMFNIYFVVMHFLAVLFAYALAREFKLSRMAAMVTGLCYSLGGFLGSNEWPTVMQSAIWLPLTLLFLLRALGSGVLPVQMFNACLAGLTMGLSALGGSLTLLVMQLIVVLTAAAFSAWQGEGGPESADVYFSSRFRISALTAGAAVLVTVCTGALHLFPAFHDAPKTVQFFGDQMATGDATVPYRYIKSSPALPDSVVTFLFPYGFGGAAAHSDFPTPYLGVLPFLLAIYALVTCRGIAWVRYFGFLVLGCTLYWLAQFSPLHGVLYALTPKFWMLPDSVRIVYLISFALALLAGFGADALFRNDQPASSGELSQPLRFYDRSLIALAIGCGLILIAGSVFNLTVNPWNYLSVVMVFLACGIYRAAREGKIGRFAQCFAVFFILFDLGSFDQTAQIKTDVQSHDEMLRLLSCESVSKFINAQQGPFRIELPMPKPPDIGDTFGVLTTKGEADVQMADYVKMQGRPDLLDVQLALKPATAGDPSPVYADNNWKLYRVANRYQHAWLVHKAETVSEEARFASVNDTGFDFLQTATTTDSLNGQLDPPAAEAGADRAHISEYSLNRIKIAVTAKGRALLVVSEIYDNDWTAKVNGNRAVIHAVDGGLRGIVVPDGQSTVEMRYRPTSVVAGAVVSGLTIMGTIGFWVYIRRKGLHRLPSDIATEPGPVELSAAVTNSIEGH